MHSSTAKPATRRSIATPVRLAALAALLSAVAVCIVVSPAAGMVSAPLAKMAGLLAAPGELLCFATVGGAFSGCPRDLSGYALWVAGAAAFWFFAALAFASGLHFLWRLLDTGSRSGKPR